MVILGTLLVFWFELVVVDSAQWIHVVGYGLDVRNCKSITPELFNICASGETATYVQLRNYIHPYLYSFVFPFTLLAVYTVGVWYPTTDADLQSRRRVDPDSYTLKLKSTSCQFVAIVEIVIWSVVFLIIGIVNDVNADGDALNVRYWATCSVWMVLHFASMIATTLAGFCCVQFGDTEIGTSSSTGFERIVIVTAFGNIVNNLFSIYITLI